jgi:hypothetical protein
MEKHLKDTQSMIRIEFLKNDIKSYTIWYDKAKNLTSVIFTREKSDILSTKADQLRWRRTKVIEMRARGLTQVFRVFRIIGQLII